MNEHIYRDTWAEIDLQAIEHNVKAIREKLPETTKVMAIVKADGYGHGSVAVAKRALKAGATQLGVALLEEAITLREAGIDVPILVMGWVSAKYAPIAAAQNITLTVFQEEWLENIPKELPQKLNIHLKWDTGMGRIGVRTIESIEKLVNKVQAEDELQLTGVFTHFATADGEDLNYFQHQRGQFQKLLNDFAEIWPNEIDVHIGNSAASIRFPKSMYQMIRFGVSMYGLYPSPYVKQEKLIELKQAFSLHSRLSHVKKARK